MTDIIKKGAAVAACFAALIIFAHYQTALQIIPAAEGQESDLKIKSINVSIWPEYDDPRILVIYHGEFEDMSEFPTWVDFYIPQDAEINGAGIDTPDGRQLLQDHTIRQEGVRSVISISLSRPTFFLEYYYNPLTKGPQKFFEHKIENKYPVDTMIVRVQKPLKAEEFTLIPGYDSSFQDPQGFVYYQYNLHNLAAESSVNITASYKKEDPNPSIVKKAQPPLQGFQEPATVEKKEVSSPASAGVPMRALFGVIFLAVAAVVAAAFIMKKAAARREEVAEEPEKPISSKDGWNFCPDCGARLTKGYTFCPGCGKNIGK